MSHPSWQERLQEVYELMAEMSRQTEPQAMVQAYGQRVRRMFPFSRRISLSRRDLNFPLYRITRYSEWKEEINPWTQKDRLPLLSGGLLADLIYSNRPHLIDELQVAKDDPAAEYLLGQRSLVAVPMLDDGQALNMVITTQTESHAFDRERFPDTVWLANLFGRATGHLVLKEQLRVAYEAIDRELAVVSEIQRSLLPREMPDIQGLKLAAYYRTSQRAGGDYYDFFKLPGGKWGLLIADVSGHGTPAAVVMAITHSIAHLAPGEHRRPGELLHFVNKHLTRRYTEEIGAFVTAFYGVFDPQRRSLTYASAGHNPPRLWKAGPQHVQVLDQAGGFPLGLMEAADFEETTIALAPGDRLVLYTDGVTEAMSPGGALFGTHRLDEILAQCCPHGADDLMDSIVDGLLRHTDDNPPTDDRTLVVATVVDEDHPAQSSQTSLTSAGTFT